ncbi:MAG: methyltransferase domain-containing protein [Pseudomonadota bacterium]
MRFKDLLRPGSAMQIMDVGAACINERPVYRPLLDEDLGLLNAFEGDTRQTARIRETYGDKARVFTDFLADGQVHTLYMTHADSGMTSLFKPKSAALKFFNQFEHFGKVERTVQVQTTRLDDVADVPAIDFLKMDVQGSELAVLMHGKKRLAQCVAIQLEVSYICLYEGQPTFGEIDVWMRANGYVPHCFVDVKRWSIAPTIKNNNFKTPFNQLLESDIVYIKDPLNLPLLTHAQLKNLALIAHYSLASYDLCVYVLLELIARKQLPAAAHGQYLELLAGGTPIEMPTPTAEMSKTEAIDDTMNASPLWIRFESCPLCGSTETVLLRSDSCENYPIWQPGLPTKLDWMHCEACQHIFSRNYFTEQGLSLLFSKAHPMQVTGLNLDQERARWAPTVERIQGHLQQQGWMGDSMVWLDVGCGAGGLVITAAEYGFNAIGLDSRVQAVERIEALGYSAVVGDLMELQVTDPVMVMSLADVLEHVPFPRQALKQVHAALMPGGLVMISCPNLDSGSWRKANADGVNPYWSELEHHHNFSRASLMRLLAEEGFIPIDYSISTRYKSCMEVIARRA